MVLRSSPWESRTSLTNKGHFARKRPPGALFAACGLLDKMYVRIILAFAGVS